MDPIPKGCYKSVNSVGTRCRKKAATVTHVEPKWADIRPGIRVIESIIDHEIQQVTPVPRVDRSVGSSAQISFPGSPGEVSLAFVHICRDFGEAGPETGGGASKSHPTRPNHSQGSGDGRVFFGFGVFEVEVVSAEVVSGWESSNLNIEEDEKCLLFLEVFVNLGVVPDHLRIRFDCGELG